MKRIITVLLGIAMLSQLSACATVSASEDVIVSPPTAMGRQWAVGGEAKWDASTAVITVSVNGETVTQFEDTPYQLISAMGSYQGHPVQVVCPAADLPIQHPWCLVYLDGMHSATLFF